jgi:hypothetical protein
MSETKEVRIIQDVDDNQNGLLAAEAEKRCGESWMREESTNEAKSGQQTERRK